MIGIKARGGTFISIGCIYSFVIAILGAVQIHYYTLRGVLGLWKTSVRQGGVAKVQYYTLKKIQIRRRKKRRKFLLFTCHDASF